MARPAHERITFSGVRGLVSAPLERWSFSLNMPASTTNAAFSDAQMDGLAEGARLAYAANIADVLQLDTVLTETRWAIVGADGHVATRAAGDYKQGIVTTTVAGSGGASNLMPLEVALVVSLVTGRAGPTGKGRVFLPWPAFLTDTVDKRLPAASAQTVADAFAAFITDLNSIGTQTVSVVSSKGYLSPVTGVKVGRVPDVLRSRRRDQPEGYVLADL